MADTIFEPAIVEQTVNGYENLLSQTIEKIIKDFLMLITEYFIIGQKR